MAAVVSKDVLLDKLNVVKKDKDVILFKQLEGGCHVGITAEDFAEMLSWILQSPALEETKQRFMDSGYVKFFEEWLAKGVVSMKDLQELFGGKLPWR